MWSRRKKKVEDLLFSREPITVRHATPATLTPEDKRCWGADDHDFECFKNFRHFADWINKLYEDIEGPFRLQELNDTALTGDMSAEGPAYGRRYDLYFNQCPIGLLQVRSGDRGFLGTDPADRYVDVEVKIHKIRPRLLPYGHLRGFLQTIASLIANRDRPAWASKATEYAEALDRAVVQHLWEDSQDTFESLIVQISGDASHYYFIRTSEIRGRINRLDRE